MKNGHEGLLELYIKNNFKKYLFNIILILRLSLLGISFQHSADKFINLHIKGLCAFFSYFTSGIRFCRRK